MENNEKTAVESARGNLLFSPFLSKKNAAKKIAYVAVFTALSAITNMFLEIKVFDVQYSLTILVSVITGVVLGPASGFLACMLGDFLGYVVNSWGYLYFVWVGVSTGVTAFIGGMIFNGIKGNDIAALLLKTGLTCLLHLVICTVGISSTGFYFYNRVMGFSEAFLNYASSVFGGNADYFAYLVYRLIIKGQIFNSLVNYAALYIVVLGWHARQE